MYVILVAKGPLDAERLSKAVELLDVQTVLELPEPSRCDVLWVPYRGSVRRLPIDEVRRIEAERDYVRVVDQERSYLLRGTLSEMFDRLDDRFVRIHRSTVVARREITGFRHVGGGSWVVIDRDGGEFAIGRTYLATVRAVVL